MRRPSRFAPVACVDVQRLIRTVAGYLRKTPWSAIAAEAPDVNAGRQV